jgi:hypothetical protein
MADGYVVDCLPRSLHGRAILRIERPPPLLEQPL